MYCLRSSCIFRYELFNSGLYLFILNIISANGLFGSNEKKPLAYVATIFDYACDTLKLAFSLHTFFVERQNQSQSNETGSVYLI